MKFIPIVNIAAMAIDSVACSGITLSFGLALIFTLRTMTMRGIDISNLPDKELARLFTNSFKDKFKDYFHRSKRQQNSLLREEFNLSKQSDDSIPEVDVDDIEKKKR